MAASSTIAPGVLSFAMLGVISCQEEISMLSPLRYLYASLFRWHANSHKTKNPALAAALSLAILLTVNFQSVIMALVLFQGPNSIFGHYYLYGTYLLVGVGVLIAISVWLLFVLGESNKNRRHEMLKDVKLSHDTSDSTFAWYFAISALFPAVIVITHLVVAR
jgi:hypothetical protein